MRKTNLGKKLSLLLPIGALIAFATPRAFADAELVLNDGAGNIVTLFDGGIVATGSYNVTFSFCSGDTCTFDGSIGSWYLNVTTGTGGSSDTPLVDLSSINGTSGSATGQTLTIAYSINGLTPAAPGFTLTDGGTINAGGTLDASLFGGNSNVVDDQSQQIGSTLSYTGACGSPTCGFALSENASLAGPSVSPYSLTEVETVTFGGAAGQFSADYAVNASPAVPESAGLLLLGSAMLLAVLGRKAIARF